MAVKELQVDMEGDDTMIVRKAGTDFLVAYQMRPNEPFLIMTIAGSPSPEVADFRVKAIAASRPPANGIFADCGAQSRFGWSLRCDLS
jgi:hypothetical protein